MNLVLHLEIVASYGALLTPLGIDGATLSAVGALRQ